jgi:Tfp pilus assembly protein PilO
MEMLNNINRARLKQDYLRSVQRFKQFGQKPESKVSGLISLTIFTVAFFGLFAIMPTFKTIASLKREVKDIEQINQKLSLKIQALNKAEDIYGQQINNLPLVNSILPEMAEFERFAWQVEWLALNKGVQFESGSFNKFPLVNKETVEGLQSIETELTIMGNYLNTKDFLKALGQMDRLVSISNLTISSKKIKQSAGLISTSIKLSASYFPYAN